MLTTVCAMYVRTWTSALECACDTYFILRRRDCSGDLYGGGGGDNDNGPRDMAGPWTCSILRTVPALGGWSGDSGREEVLHIRATPPHSGIIWTRRARVCACTSPVRGVYYNVHARRRGRRVHLQRAREEPLLDLAMIDGRRETPGFSYLVWTAVAVVLPLGDPRCVQRHNAAAPPRRHHRHQHNDAAIPDAHNAPTRVYIYIHTPTMYYRKTTSFSLSCDAAPVFVYCALTIGS